MISCRHGLHERTMRHDCHLPSHPSRPQLVFAVATAASYHNACCQLHMFT